MSESNGYADPAAIRAMSEKTVDVPVLGRFLIRRVSPSEIMLASGQLPDLSRLAAVGPESDAVSRLAREDPESLRKGVKLIEEVVLRGVVRPQVCRSDQDGLTLGHLGWEAVQFLFAAITEHSGWSRARAEEVLPLSRTSD